MRIFLSYASEDKAVAEAIAFSLRARNHTDFLDRDDLPAGGEYDRRIEQAVSQAGLLVFLISPNSVARGRFTLTELEFARRRWRKADGHVLPVMIEPTAMAEVPGFLKSVTILEPKGNAAAEVASAVDEMAASTVRKGTLVFAGFGLASGLLTVPLLQILPDLGESPIGRVPLTLWLGGILFAAALAAALSRQHRPQFRHLLIGIAVMLGWYIAIFVFLSRDPPGESPLSDIFVSKVEIAEQCKQVASGQLTADAALEKSCLEIKLAETKSELWYTRSYFRQLISYGLSGTIGAFITVLGIPMATGRRYPIAGMAATTAVGLVAGSLYFVAISAVPLLKAWDFHVLFISWQPAVAATIGRFLR